MASQVLSRLLAPVVAITTVGLALVTTGGQATAGAVASPTATGKVTVFPRTDFTGPPLSFPYTSCRPSSSRVVRLVGSYDNRPLDGCQVVLRNSRGAEHKLCAGRAVVPPRFREGPRLIIRPGGTAPCAS
jgi:hypothetical protein